jgi:hypothetical protein
MTGLIILFSTTGLVGCATGDRNTAPKEIKSSASESQVLSPSSLPVEEGIVGIPLSETCESLISIQDLYNFNPNFALDPSQSPAPGSLAKLATDYKGISCYFVNLSSGESVTVSLAKFDDQGFTRLQQVREKESFPSKVSFLPAEFLAFFAPEDQGGTIEVLGNNYWLTAKANWAQNAEDFNKLIANSIAKLGQ